MKICLVCRRPSPRGSIYCGECGGSFGGTRCSQGHLTPGLARLKSCPFCGTSDLATPIRSLNIGPIIRGSTWFVTLLAVRFMFGHLGSVFALFMSLASWIFGRTAVSVIIALMALAVALRVLSPVSNMFNPESARKLESAGRATETLLHVVVFAAKTIGRLLVWTIEGPTTKSRKSKSKLTTSRNDEEGS